MNTIVIVAAVILSVVSEVFKGIVTFKLCRKGTINAEQTNKNISLFK